MVYSIEISHSAEKSLKAIPLQIQTRIITKINALSSQPRPSGCKKLLNSTYYRIRVGDYRIIYEIIDKIIKIIILDIGHRKDIYR